MMRARALLCVGLVTAACAAGEADVRRPPGGPGAPRSGVPGVRAIGRFDTQDPAGPRFAWSGTGVAIRFRGPQLDARLRGGGGDSLEVVIDGVPTTAITLQTGKELYPVATGLADSEHEAVLVKRTEARVGEVQLLGFAQPLLPAPPAPERRIEVIGDSITAGYGNEGPN